MSWPIGSLYLAARTKSLAALTAGIRASRTNAVPLTDWRRFSSIRIVSATRRKIDVECNSAELRSSLVAEIEYWADREVELRSIVLRTAQPSSGVQESWWLVSVYYWAVFSASLLLRIVGTPVFRMTGDEVKVLRELVPGATDFPSEGTFRLEQVAVTSATSESVSLVRLRSNYHKSLWVAVEALLREIHTATVASNASLAEKTIAQSMLWGLSPPERLSDLRNLVNYRSGVGFPADMRGVGFATVPLARLQLEFDAKALVGEISAASAAVRVAPSVSFDSNNARFLYWTAIALSWLSQALYAEVSKTVRFDSTWRNRRTAFARSLQYGCPPTVLPWLPL